LSKYFLLFICAVSLTAAYDVTTYTYKTVGDLQIKLDVYTPPVAAPSTGYPVFFAIHGGGLVSKSKTDAFTSQELDEVMKRGWALVSINYRLLPSVFLEDIVQDMQDAYTFVRTELVKHVRINPDIMTVFGQSGGGGLATISGYKFSPRPKVIIGFYPGRPNWTDTTTYDPSTPVNPAVVAAANKLANPVRTQYNSTGKGDPRMALYAAANANHKFGWLAMTHDPNYSPAKIVARLKALSSAENVDKDYPPTYLAHGLADTTVPYSQSVMLSKSLDKFGITHVLDLVPNVNHGFDRGASQTLFNQHVLPAFDFAQKYMGSSSQAVHKAVAQSREFLKK